MVNKKRFNKTVKHYALTPGDTIKQLRELQGLSQNDFSELTGIPQSNISAVENGMRQIGRERAVVFAIALKVHPAVILFPDFDINKVA